MSANVRGLCEVALMSEAKSETFHIAAVIRSGAKRHLGEQLASRGHYPKWSEATDSMTQANFYFLNNALKASHKAP